MTSDAPAATLARHDIFEVLGCIDTCVHHLSLLNGHITGWTTTRRWACQTAAGILRRLPTTNTSTADRNLSMTRREVLTPGRASTGRDVARELMTRWAPRRPSLSGSIVHTGDMDLISRAESWLCDMDGVLIRDGAMIPGADKFLDRLRSTGRPYLILTNNSLFSPQRDPPRARPDGSRRRGESPVDLVAGDGEVRADPAAVRERLRHRPGEPARGDP